MVNQRICIVAEHKDTLSAAIGVSDERARDIIEQFGNLVPEATKTTDLISHMMMFCDNDTEFCFAMIMLGCIAARNTMEISREL